MRVENKLIINGLEINIRASSEIRWLPSDTNMYICICCAMYENDCCLLFKISNPPGDGRTSNTCCGKVPPDVRPGCSLFDSSEIPGKPGRCGLRTQAACKNTRVPCDS